MMGFENQRIAWMVLSAVSVFPLIGPGVPAPQSSQPVSRSSQPVPQVSRPAPQFRQPETQSNQPAPQSGQPASAPAPREIIDVGRFRHEVARFAEWDRKNSPPRDAVLFVGSSSIRMWPTREAFPNWPVINRGFGGSTIAEVSHYFKQVVEPYHPRVIVFYAGDNDIAEGRTPEQVRDDFAAFMKLVRSGSAAAPAARPNGSSAVGPTTRPSSVSTPVVFLSIKPSESRWQLWPAMQRANALIRELSQSTPGLTYLDVGTPLLDSAGKPRPELFVEDNLHLSPAGYAEWKKVLEPVVEKLFAEAQ